MTVLQTVASPAEPLETQDNSHADAGRRSAGRSEPLADLTSDLARLVERWPTLPDHIKAAINALASVGPPSFSPSPADTTGRRLDDVAPPGFERQTKNEGGPQ